MSFDRLSRETGGVEKEGLHNSAAPLATVRADWAGASALAHLLEVSCGAFGAHQTRRMELFAEFDIDEVLFSASSAFGVVLSAH